VKRSSTVKGRVLADLSRGDARSGNSAVHRDPREAETPAERPTDLNVLAVVDSLAQGGAERSLLDLASEMQKHGIITTLATLRDERVGFSLEGLGIERIRIRGATALGRVTNLRSHIQTGQFDLVHTVLFASDITGRLAAWATGTAVLSSIVNTTYDPDRLLDPHISAWKVDLLRRIDGWTARNLTDRLHAVSLEVRDSTTRALGVPDSRVVVIPRGRDPDQFRPVRREARDAVRLRMGLEPQAPVFLAVGRHEYQKGHATILDAWPTLLDELPDAVLLLAGRPGHESQRLAHMAESLEITESVRFLGFRRDIPDLLAASDLFVFPSHYEGLGGALLEAMASQVPIVVSDLAVTREVLGEDAWFFPAGVAPALAVAIVAAYHRSDDAIPSAARARFMERYTLEAIAARMAALYREIVDTAS
jgi:glycosyltransferase involved in cell wall biosynthesis